jgi:hypothetical protein
MTAGSSMLAMILSWPPQRAQLSISIPNTRFSRRAQLIATCRGVGSPGRIRARLLRHPQAPVRGRHRGAHLAVRGEHAVEARQVPARRRHQRRQARHQVQRLSSTMWVLPYRYGVCEGGSARPALAALYENEFIREHGQCKILRRVDDPLMPTAEEWRRETAAQQGQ